MTTDVLVSIDAATIYNTFKSAQTTADKPQPVGAAHVSVMTSDGQKSTQNVTDIQVEEGDQIAWWVQCTGLHTCVIYNFVDAKTGQAIGPDSIISKPQLKQLKGQLLTKEDNPNSPTFQSSWLYFWGADAQSTGTLSYGVQFAIYDHNGTVLGYYQFVGAGSVS
jgi:Inclusion body protein